MYKVYKTYKDKLLNPEKIQKFSWIDLNTATDEEVAELNKIVEIPEEILVAIRDDDEVPRFEKYDDFQFILLQTPRSTLEEEEEDSLSGDYSVSPLGIIYTDEYVITISDGKNDVVNYLKNKLKNFQKNKIINTSQIPQLILKFLLFTSKVYLRYLKVMNRKIREAQSNLEQSPENDQILRLMDLEKTMVYFNTSLHSNQIVIEKLTKRKFFKMTEDDEELSEDVLDENRQAIATVGIYSKIIAHISGAFSSVISNNVSQTVRFLTSITIILMIPTLVASVYGMNVSLPFQNSPKAFIAVMVFSVVLSMLAIFVLYRKKLF